MFTFKCVCKISKLFAKPRRSFGYICSPDIAKYSDHHPCSKCFGWWFSAVTRINQAASTKTDHVPNGDKQKMNVAHGFDKGQFGQSLHPFEAVTPSVLAPSAEVELLCRTGTGGAIILFRAWQYFECIKSFSPYSSSSIPDLTNIHLQLIDFNRQSCQTCWSEGCCPKTTGGVLVSTRWAQQHTRTAVFKIRRLIVDGRLN